MVQEIFWRALRQVYIPSSWILSLLWKQSVVAYRGESISTYILFFALVNCVYGVNNKCPYYLGHFNESIWTDTYWSICSPLAIWYLLKSPDWLIYIIKFPRSRDKLNYLIIYGIRIFIYSRQLLIFAGSQTPQSIWKNENKKLWTLLTNIYCIRLQKLCRHSESCS